MPEAVDSNPELTFSLIAARFAESLAESAESERERRSKRAILKRHLVPEFAGVPLGALSAQDIERYKASKLAQGLSPKTVNNHLAVLRRLLRFARAARIIPRSPRILNLTFEPKAPAALSRDQAQRLIDAAEGGFRVMMTLALRAGLRLGELRALTWANLDLSEGRVRVGGGSGRRSAPEREIPLSPRTLAMLRDHPRRGQFVFSNADGSKLTHGACKWPLYRAARRAGLEAIGWQMLRNTFAHELFERGVSPRSVQALLGCRHLAPVLRHATSAEDNKMRAILLLDVKDVAHQSGGVRWKGSPGRRPAEAGRELPSPVLVLMSNDRWQRAQLAVPAFRVARVAVLPAVTGLEPAN